MTQWDFELFKLVCQAHLRENPHEGSIPPEWFKGRVKNDYNLMREVFNEITQEEASEPFFTESMINE